MSHNTRSSGRRKKPNAAFYVGYVEDDETPEMIMKKFQQMERMQQAVVKANREQKKLEEEKNPAANKKSSKAEMSDSDEEEAELQKVNGMLSEDQLVALFNDTSYYSINSLKRNNDIMFQKQTVDEEGFVVGIDDPDYEKLMFEVDYDITQTEMLNWMDPEEDDYIGEDEFWDDDKDETKSSTKRTRRSNGDKSTRTRERFSRFQGHGIGHSSLRRGESSHAGPRTMEKKIMCHEPNYLKVPAYPIPRSWLKPIQKYDDRTIDQFIGHYYAEKDILSMKRKTEYFFQNNSIKKYRAILMDPPFDLSESPVYVPPPNDEIDEKDRFTIKLAEFAKLPIGEIIPIDYGGMLFIWVPSELTMQVNDICEQWGFLLVEHATWIMRNIRHQIENRESNLFGISKQNLMLYRRTKKNGKTFNKLELRHQRTSDSYFDFVRFHRETGHELKSNYHYKVIETLLPDLDDKENGQALFLWSPKDEMRNGWTCIADSNQVKQTINTRLDNDW